MARPPKPPRAGLRGLAGLFRREAARPTTPIASRLSEEASRPLRAEDLPNSIGSGNRRLYHLQDGDRHARFSQDVVRNPSWDEINDIIDNNIENGTTLRTLADRRGNIYVWPENFHEHADIATALIDRGVSIRIDQYGDIEDAIRGYLSRSPDGNIIYSNSRGDVIDARELSGGNEYRPKWAGPAAIGVGTAAALGLGGDNEAQASPRPLMGDEPLSRFDMPPLDGGVGQFDPTNAPGLLEPGNIDIYDRPEVPNADGSISTVRSMSFGDEQGREILVPTVSEDGRIMSDDEAIDSYYRTGRHLGIFNSPQAATNYADALHGQQAEFYGAAPGRLSQYDMPPLDPGAERQGWNEQLAERMRSVPAWADTVLPPHVPGGMSALADVVQEPIDFGAEMLAGANARSSADRVRSGQPLSLDPAAEIDYFSPYGPRPDPGYRAPFFEEPGNLYYDRQQERGGRTPTDRVIDAGFAPIEAAGIVPSASSARMAAQGLRRLGRAAVRPSYDATTRTALARGRRVADVTPYPRDAEISMRSPPDMRTDWGLRNQNQVLDRANLEYELRRYPPDPARINAVTDRIVSGFGPEADRYATMARTSPTADVGSAVEAAGALTGPERAQLRRSSPAARYGPAAALGGAAGVGIIGGSRYLIDPGEPPPRESPQPFQITAEPIERESIPRAAPRSMPELSREPPALPPQVTSRLQERPLPLPAPDWLPEPTDEMLARLGAEADARRAEPLPPPGREGFDMAFTPEISPRGYGEGPAPPSMDPLAASQDAPAGIADVQQLLEARFGVDTGGPGYGPLVRGGLEDVLGAPPPAEPTEQDYQRIARQLLTTPRDNPSPSDVAYDIQSGLLAMGRDIGGTKADRVIGPNTARALNAYLDEMNAPPELRVAPGERDITKLLRIWNEYFVGS